MPGGLGLLVQEGGRKNGRRCPLAQRVGVCTCAGRTPTSSCKVCGWFRRLGPPLPVCAPHTTATKYFEFPWHGRRFFADPRSTHCAWWCSKGELYARQETGEVTHTYTHTLSLSLCCFLSLPPSLLLSLSLSLSLCISLSACLPACLSVCLTFCLLCGCVRTCDTSRQPWG